MIFEGEDTLFQFCHWLFQTYNKSSICIAHNFSGYDGQFILRHNLGKGMFKPDVVIKSTYYYHYRSRKTEVYRFVAVFAHAPG